MDVIKRDGSSEPMKFDKITNRIRKQTYGLNNSYIDPSEVAQKVIDGIYDGITTEELDRLAAQTCAAMTTIHSDFSLLGGRITASSLQKSTPDKFSEAIDILYNYVEPRTGELAGIISDEVYDTVQKNKDVLDKSLNKDRDFDFDYFGIKTLERAYLLKTGSKIIETPQYMYMRVALGLWGDDIKKVISLYDLLSNQYYTHATPTLFNSGTKHQQNSSCFLLSNKGDSIEKLFETIQDIAMISKWSGGIGVHVHHVRGKGSYIKGTGGVSDGLVPMMRTYNEVVKWVDQGGGKRKGSVAVYLEPWHCDVEDFISLRKNHGNEELRARDLFLALWVPDLFMKRVDSDEEWTLFSPNEALGLDDVYDDGESNKFTKLYEKYERDGRGRKTVKARELFYRILDSQIETGAPYFLFKDSCNKKSNQKNLGTIKSSNLCAEIIEYSSDKEQAVCNLASLSLPSFVDIPQGRVMSRLKGKRSFNFDRLFDVAYQATINLDRIIDVNFYPTKETKRSNIRHRPLGLGVQGLADTFAMIGIPFESEEAVILNKNIFETIYYSALTASNDLAKESGPYETYKGSPVSDGILQFDMWGGLDETSIHNWTSLKKKIAKYGIRNSLLVTCMPTASTSQILGNAESFEPFTSNIFTRRVLSGEYIVVNKHLIEDLVELNIWNEDVKNKILLENGSVQNIDEIPDEIKKLYKTVWEVSQKHLVSMSADRGKYICHSQSLNLFLRNANKSKLTTALFYGWKLGLKTGMYYLRSSAPRGPIKGLGIDMSKVSSGPKEVECSTDLDSCEICSS